MTRQPEQPEQEQEQEQEQPAEERQPQPRQLHPADLGAFRGMPASPPAGDVEGVWLRSPKTGLLSFVPSDKMADTIKRCLSEGFTLEPPPWESGRPVNGQPTKPKGDELGLGGTMSVYHG
jgi:hypothetical protein